MGLPGWALVALIGVPLAQIPLVLVLSRWFELDGEAPAPMPGRGVWVDDGDGHYGAADRRPAGQCRRCGLVNDPTYTFCGGCTARL